MFEEMTFESILEEMLARVPDDVDKREGSVVYDMLAPMAAELAIHYSQLEGVLALMFPDGAQGEYLDKLGALFGVERRNATKALRQGSFVGQEDSPLEVAQGSRLMAGECAFSVVEKLAEGSYSLECETPGVAGNLATGTLTPIDNITGLARATLGDVLAEAVDQEEDEEYRQRIISAASKPAYGGNVPDYQNHALDMDGVGAVKVFPAWQGGGTVRLILGGPDGRAVTEELVQKTLAYFVGEPEGSGVAPIGHEVTVASCQNKELDITLQVALEDDAQEELVKSEAEDALRRAVEQMDFEDEMVYLAKLVAAVVPMAGVKDVPMTGVTINGENQNLPLEKTPENYEVPVVSSVTVVRAEA